MRHLLLGLGVALLILTGCASANAPVDPEQGGDGGNGTGTGGMLGKGGKSGGADAAAPGHDGPTSVTPAPDTGADPVPADAADDPDGPALAHDAAAGGAGGNGGTGGSGGARKYALYEDFESYKDGDLPDPAVWAQKTTKATVDGMHARGSKALHVPPIIHDSVVIRETKTFPALGKAFYARVYLWVDKEPLEKPPNLYHWTMIEASDTPEGSGRKVRLGGHIEASTTGDWLRFNYETSQPTTPHETGLSDKGAIVEPRKWTCIEIYFEMNKQEARVWLNGQERTALHWLDSMPSKPLFHFPTEIKGLSFGWTEYQPPQTPFEVWLDDIAVDGARIGCD